LFYKVVLWRKPMRLYTIGYQDRNLDDFICELKSFGISVLIDVREIPVSRKKGFSKTSLYQYLEENDIQYIHLKDLGSPKSLREKLRSDGDYSYFFNEYQKYIKSQAVLIEDLYQMVSDNICCLMCYEKIPKTCHRSIVANEVTKIDSNGLRIVHI